MRRPSIQSMMLCIAVVAVDLRLIHFALFTELNQISARLRPVILVAFGLLPLTNSIPFAMMIRKWRPYALSATAVVVILLTTAWSAPEKTEARTLPVLSSMQFLIHSLPLSRGAGLGVEVLLVFGLFSAPSIVLAVIVTVIARRAFSTAPSAPPEP